MLPPASRAVGSIAACATVLAALAALPTEAHACSCVPAPPPADAFAQASAVFEARVSRLDVDTTALRATAHLIVVRQWKGDLPEDVTVTTASQSSLCGFTFTPDSRVLLYADGELDALSVSMCSRSRPVESAAEDLAALLDRPVSGPRRATPAPGAGHAGPPGGGGTGGPPAGHAGGTSPTPRSGGCGGCGGASVAGLGLVLAGGRRRRHGA